MSEPFLVFEEFKVKSGACNLLAVDVLFAYGYPKLSVSQYKKRNISIKPWADKKGVVHRPTLSFGQLAESIQEHREFRPELFDLYPIPIRWLDDSIAMGGNTAAFTITSSLNYGSNFPIKPTISGPGAVVAPFKELSKIT